MIVGVQDFLEETDGRLNLGGYEKVTGEPHLS